MKIHAALKGAKLIPLYENSKAAKVKWATNEDLPFNGEETGYGVDTERSHLIVIDCDMKPEAGINGVENFILHYIDKEGAPPTTLTVETPNDGIHLYFQAPEGSIIRGSVSKLLPGVDVRAIGSYIVGPGSMGTNSKGVVKEYVAQEANSEIALPPEWLLKELNALEAAKGERKTPSKKKGKEKTIPRAAVTSTKDVSPREELEQKYALEWGKDNVMAATEGIRNDALNHSAYFMGVKKVPEEEAKVLIDLAIAGGLREDEAERTFYNGYNDGLLADNTSFDVCVKEYNTRMGKSFKDDPMDNEFYGHVSLSYNFWKRYADFLVFWKHTSSWYIYMVDTGAWTSASEEEVRAILKKHLEDQVNAIRNQKQEKGEKIPAPIYKAQERLWLKQTIDSVLVLSRSDFLRTEPDLFDSQPYLLNVKNGVFDLKTGELSPHAPSLYLSKHIPFNVNLEAEDPYCDMIVNSVDPREKEFLQLVAGQSLVGEQPTNQAVFFLLGRGSNGKSTFINLMLRTSGSYARLQPPTVFLPDQGREIYAMADFDRLRCAIVEELPDAKTLNSGSLKRLAGTRYINARVIYGSNREFENQSTIFVSCNKLPMVNETDDGTWRRLLVFNFPFSFKRTDSEVVNSWDRKGSPMVIYSANHSVKTAEAFLAWRIKGAMRWVANKEIELNVPSSIVKTVEAWNENNDIFLAWFNDCLEKDASSYVTLTDAFNSFNEWAVARGHTKVSQRYFTSVFVGHKCFLNNKASYKTRSKIPQSLGLERSFSPEDREKAPHKENVSYFLGLKFKN